MKETSGVAIKARDREKDIPPGSVACKKHKDGVMQYACHPQACVARAVVFDHRQLAHELHFFMEVARHGTIFSRSKRPMISYYTHYPDNSGAPLHTSCASQRNA